MKGAHSCCLSLTRRGTLREKHEVNRESVVLGTFFSIQSGHCTSSVLVYLNSGMTLGNNFLVYLYLLFSSITLKATLPGRVAKGEHKVSFHQVIALTMLRTGSYVNWENKMLIVFQWLQRCYCYLVFRKTVVQLFSILRLLPILLCFTCHQAFLHRQIIKINFHNYFRGEWAFWLLNAQGTSRTACNLGSFSKK